MKFVNRMNFRLSWFCRWPATLCLLLILDRQRGGRDRSLFWVGERQETQNSIPTIIQKRNFAEFFKSCLSKAYFFYHYSLFEKNILYIILQKWSKKIKTVENAVYWEQKNVTPQSVHAYAKMDTLEKTVLVSQITKRYELWFR